MTLAAALLRDASVARADGPHPPGHHAQSQSSTARADQPASDHAHHHAAAAGHIERLPADHEQARIQMKRGREAFAAGDYATAAQAFERSLALCGEEPPDAFACDAVRALAAAQQALGHFNLAESTLGYAIEVTRDPRQRMAMLASRGSIPPSRASTDAAAAQAAARRRDLDEALSLAETLPDDAFRAAARASIENDLGNLLSARAEFRSPDPKLDEQNRAAYDDCAAHYDRAAALARQAREDLLHAKALVNRALLAAAYPHAPDRSERLDEAARAVANLPDGHESALLLLTLAQIESDLADSDEDAAAQAARAARVRRAFEKCERARAIARAVGSARAECYAWGIRGRLHELVDPDLSQALIATRKAVFLAQQLRSPDAMYLWERQSGRLLARSGRRPDAIAAYQRSTTALRDIRNDLALFGLRRGESFRENVGTVYYELADLLLQEAAEAKEPATVQRSLRAARAAVEQLKAAELEDYFQDECVNLLKQQERDLDAVLEPGEALLYVIPLADRTELLLTLPQRSGGGAQLQRFQTDITGAELQRLARTFRRQILRKNFACNEQGARLYDVLIRPVLETLRAEGVRTLVFVPDGELRAVPLAALFDQPRQQYLIDEFAVAVSPGLSVIPAESRPRELRRRDVQVLVAVLWEERDGFPELRYVSDELDNIRAHYDVDQLINDGFTPRAFEREVTRRPYRIVHIASHGQFDRDIEQTFILTGNGKLQLRDLEQVIQPKQFRGDPVEMLALSACETARGTDTARASLGLAGVTVKAGARSALATLWRVDDQSASVLVGQFYRTLKQQQSKAESLRQAQAGVRRPPDDPDAVIEHGNVPPYYWSAFIVIGDWR